MDIELLSTQLVIPPPTRHLVARDRLRDLLEEGVTTARLTLVSAPAGYGKTTLLAQWARASRLPVAWLSASTSVNHPVRFLRCLLTAWDTAQPGIRAQPPGILLSDPEPDVGAVVSAVIRHASADPLAIVIDDAHLLTDPAIHEVLDTLLDHLPPGVHLVLAGREDLPLSLGRRRARNELLELRAEDLKFNLDEAGSFLRQRMELDLRERDIELLHAQVEGWAAGLQLIGLTLRHHPDTTALHALDGRHRHIADYLGDDVFARLPDPVQVFLLETSILDRLCHDLCVAVTGNQHSQDMLESLERANLFLLPLDDRRTWFRYHRLFGSFLRDRLGQLRDVETVLDLHARAARWYLEHELPEEAFRHAIEGDDIDTATEIVERYLHLLMFGGEFRVLMEWMEALPAAWFALRPELALAEAQTFLRRGQPDACLRRLGDVERLARGTRHDDPNPVEARAMTIRCIVDCFSGNLEGALEHARRALRRLPDDDYEFRAHIYHALGESYREHRRWDDARAHYLKALDILQDRPLDPGPRLLYVHVYGALADLELRQGKMQEAAGFWSRARAAIEDDRHWGRLWLPIGGWVYLRIAELHYEWNDLEQARDLGARGLERATLGGDPQAIIAGNIILARLELAEGHPDRAADHLDRAREILETASFPDWIGRFDRCQADLWIARGAIREAVAWCQAQLTNHAAGSREASGQTRLAAARILLQTADPGARSRARALLDEVIQAAGARGETGVRIEGLALRAISLRQERDPPGMLADLDLALREAEPEGYVRLFADLGPQMVHVLREARTRGLRPSYVDRLVAVSGDTPPVPGTLAEPLSERERDVLALLATGLSNREIGERLFVSPETVKKHTGNIYGKLGVRGRVEAVTVARALSLLE